MFTSRAEFRLSLRADNADERLTPLAIELGVASGERSARYGEMVARVERARALAKSRTLSPNEARRHGIEVNLDGIKRSLYELLAYPNIDIANLASIEPELKSLDTKTAEALETEAKYSVYLDRQKADAALILKEEERIIPEALDFESVPGLSNELRHKMRRRRPRSLAEAQRIDGMTPAALAIILAHVRNAEAQNRSAA